MDWRIGEEPHARDPLFPLSENVMLYFVQTNQRPLFENGISNSSTSSINHHNYPGVF